MQNAEVKPRNYWRLGLLFAFFILHSSFFIGHCLAQTNVTATLSITNLTQTTNGSGANLTLQGQTIVWTNSSVASLLLQPRLVAATNTTARAATNLYAKLRSTYAGTLPFISYASSTSLVIRAPISTTLSASLNTNWGFLTFTTNQIATTNLTGSLAASNLIAFGITLGAAAQRIDSWNDVTNFFAQSTGVGGSATNVYLGRAELATVTTNAEGNWTVNVTTNAVRSVLANTFTNTGTTRLEGTNWLGTVRLPLLLQADADVEVWTNNYGPVFPTESFSGDNGIYWQGYNESTPSFGFLDGGEAYAFNGLIALGTRTLMSNSLAANKAYLIYDGGNGRNFLRATNPTVATAYTDVGPSGVTNHGGTFTGNAASLTNFTHGPIVVAGANTTVTTNSVAGTGQKVYTVASTAGESFFWTNPVAAASASNAYHVKVSSIVGTHYGDGSALSNIAAATTFWFTNPAAASAISNALDTKARTLTASRVLSPFVGTTNAADLVLVSRGTNGIAILMDTLGNDSPNILVGTNTISLLGANSILGGFGHTISDFGSAIVGGGYNQSVGTGGYTFMGGGRSNTMSSSSFNVMIGGDRNSMSGYNQGSVIAGGISNNMTFTVGVQSFDAIGQSVIGGGAGNQIIGVTTNANYTGGQVIAGGFYNYIFDNLYAGQTIGGGFSNRSVVGDSTTIGGGRGNNVSGNYATVPGGSYNTASASNSFAAGTLASAAHHSTFVWNDSVDSFSSTGTNQFLISAGGGVGINTNAPGTNSLAVHGTVSATKFQGDGSEITGLTNFSILNVAVAKMTNIIYPSREIVLFETNASLVAGGKTTIFLTNHCLFTNWASMIGDGNWGNVTFTNSTASHWNVYVPTNLFLLTNNVGGHFFLDGFGGTNVAFVVSNGFKAKLEYEFEGASLRAGEATFRLFRPTAIP